MRKLILLLILLSFGSLLMAAVEWNQYYFCFELTNRAQLSSISEIVSIDAIKGNWVYAYANDDEWQRFSELGLNTRLLPNPSDGFDPPMATSASALRNWDSYPTYDAYVAMMYSFATAYPNLCQIIDAGTTVAGRKILFAKISDNVAVHEAEPEVMYTATIHGDESTGYILMLRLIDTLLSQYGSNPRITNLVNGMEIWINPLANPDGTYYGGNNTLSGARRNNANGYDLNRNFPSPTGTQYSGQPRQTETTIMMNLAMSHRFALSANFHGGVEVINYPWDFITTLHPDNNWYSQISRNYATSAQTNSPAGYMTYLNNGITNGAAWYVITGGRQDWMNYTAKAREVTIELSNVKLLPVSELNNHWNYNYDALLGYLENAQYGIHGIVTDPMGNSLDATITVLGIDNDYSKIRSDEVHGDFYRYLSPGIYTLTISAAGFPDRSIENVVVNANQKTELNIIMGEIPYSQELLLNQGWNMVSFHVQKPDMSPAALLSALGTNLIQIKDSSKSYCPAMANHFNTLGQIDISNAYLIKVNQSTFLSIPGTRINPTLYPITLNSGWNLVPYLPAASASVPVALASIIDHVLEVRDAQNQWLADSRPLLGDMQAGKGYWVLVNEACTLVYPNN